MSSRMDLCTLLTALSNEVDALPPSDMDTIEGRPDAAACCET